MPVFRFYDESLEASPKGMRTSWSLGKIKDVAGQSNSSRDSDHDVDELVGSNLVLRTRIHY